MIKITTVVGPLGAGDTPPCERCREPMRLIGRETHPDLGSLYELQTLECAGCGHLTTRSVDQEGIAPGA